MHSLPLFLKLSGQPVILLGTGEAAEAKRRMIERAGGITVGEDDAEARIAFVAFEAADEGAQAATRLKARGLLVNVVDQPALCDFTTPAIVDRDPVLIAVGTGGASAGLAKAVRQRVERLLPQGLGALANALANARTALRKRWPDARDRRMALDSAFREGGPLDPFTDRSADAVTDWLDHATDTQPNRTETIQLHSRDPDDLTLRAARLLGEADRIIHDGSVPPALLARARADAARLILPAGATPPEAPGLTLILHITPL
jgi:uroporphyrin-III C-methyltransferase/precorrin-2 dehydrogenase/sirohydrochlorin ferrochelatase